MALTDTAIRNAKPQAKRWRLKDGAKGLRDGGGLYLVIEPNGAKLFRMDYRRPVTGTPNTLSLGAYPATSLASARAKRDESRQLLAQRIDPAATGRLRKRPDGGRQPTALKSSPASGWRQRRPAGSRATRKSRSPGWRSTCYLESVTNLLARSPLQTFGPCWLQ